MFKNIFILISIFLLQKSANCLPTIDSDPLFDFKSSSILNLIKSNKWTCVDVVTYFMERAATYDYKIKSIISYNPNVFKRAIELDDFYSKNKNFIGKLHCVPIIVKDNIDIKGIPSTAGINAFRNVVPNKNALVIDRLYSEGAIFLAKSNMAQLAIGALYESEQVGLCLNPFDNKRTCSGSSSGSGASISAGFGIISLGTDTGGSIVGPSAYNGVFGLRTSVKPDVLDGILPLNVKKDTVGPLSKYLDDLVLAYSVMNNNLNIYENVVVKNINPSSVKVKIINNFLDSFKFVSQTKNQTIDYYVDPLLKPLVVESINRIKTTGINIQEYTLNSTELEQMTNLIKAINDETIPCMGACLPKAYNNFWNDQSRFGPDIPFKDFKDFITSPLTSDFWKGQFSQANLNLSINYNILCQYGCAKFDQLRLQFLDFINPLFSNDVDAILMPSLTTLVKLHNETHVYTKDDTFLSFAVNSDNAFLSMPSGFTPKTTESPDGLPFGMGLVIKADRMENGFKIAKLYENKQSFAKLPSSVPLFRRGYSNTANLEKNNFVMILFFLSFFVFGF